MADDCRQAHFNKNPHCPWGLVVLDRGEGAWEWEPGRGGLEGGGSSCCDRFGARIGITVYTQRWAGSKCTWLHTWGLSFLCKHLGYSELARFMSVLSAIATPPFMQIAPSHFLYILAGFWGKTSGLLGRMGVRFYLSTNTVILAPRLFQSVYISHLNNDWYVKCPDLDSYRNTI